VPERYLGQSFGKYQVESLVGSGGFAWVFKGYDPELEIPVAIKVLKPQFAGDPILVDRFRREASTAAKLRHPNIIKIYAVGRERDAVYFVMDYLPTGLADKLEATSTLPEDYVVRIGIDVARALGFAHREGVIHRDIKVDNILFDAHGNAVVADFGIARAVSGYTQHTGTNMVVGTPQYFAPEQARAKPLDGRADIYSLGVTLYRAACGRLPFEGDDWYEIARQHVEDPPPHPRTILPDLSPEFERVVLWCLAKLPDDRPATGDALAEALEALRAVHRDPTLARTLSVPLSLTPTLVAPVPAVKTRPKRAVNSTTVALAIFAVLMGGAFMAPRVYHWMATGKDAGSTVDTSLLQAPVVVSDTGAPDSQRTVVPTAPVARDTTASLVLTSYPDATLRFNGDTVGSGGTWRTDTLRPGTYVAVATVPSAAPCPTARDTAVVNLRAGRPPVKVTLHPRGCGTLQLMALVRNSSTSTSVEYTLTSLDGKRFTGPLTVGTRLGIVLPPGQYQLDVTKPVCATYHEASVTISSNAVTNLPTFTIDCGG
jgi:eukaryotic-like serine/threonine-protein kinase